MWALVVVCAAGCGAREEDVPSGLRDRLKQERRLGDEELGQLRAEVGRRVGTRTIRITDGGVSRALDGEERDAVLDVLSLEAGVFDEGLRSYAGKTFRILNGPAPSSNAEIEASQRLWVDADTLLPGRYEYTYAFPGYGADRTYELAVDR